MFQAEEKVTFRHPDMVTQHSLLWGMSWALKTNGEEGKFKISKTWFIKKWHETSK